MNRLKLAVLVTSLTTCVLATVLSSDVAAQSFSVTDSNLHYRFVMPGSWRRETPDAEDRIQRLTDEFSRKAELDPANTPLIDAAFRRLGDTPEGVASFMVQHTMVANITVANLAAELSGGLPVRAMDTLKGMGLDQIGENPIIDRARGLLVMRMTQTVEGRKIQSLTITKPGRLIVLSITLIDVSDTFPSTPEFGAILDSVQFEPGHEASPDPV